MKTVTTLISIVICFLSSISCVYKTQGYYGQQQRRLQSVTVSKVDIGRIGVRTKNTTPEQRAAVKQYVIDQYQRTDQIPSNEALSQRFGFPIQTTGFVDTPDKVVKSVTVRPDELPANIRARFE